MLELERPADMVGHIGKELGKSEWLTVDQKMIDRFAEATGDHQWIHVDVERAKREMPGGKTIAHGYLTLSLIPRLSQGIWRIAKRSRGINYGANKIRFLNPVMVGSRIRLVQTLKAAEPIEGGQRLIYEARIEIEGQVRPALIAETIALVYD
ncbi:MAG: MaoC family dehydratase [Hyphomicrobiales bacterium]|nr:MaoC family dehydratase [Hyphomicrobiales bacterium]